MEATNWQKIKTTLIILAVAVFFIGLAVILSLTLLGRRVTTDGAIEERGIVRVQDIPTGVDAYIDDEKVSIRSEIIQNIELGEHTLRLEKEDSLTWTTEITLEDSNVLNVYPFLFPKEAPISTLLGSVQVDTFVQTSETRWFFVVIDGEAENFGIWQLDISSTLLSGSSPEILKVVSFNEVDANRLKDTNYKIDATENGSFLITIPRTNTILILEKGQIFAEATKLDNLLGFVPEHVRWFNGDNSILVEQDTILYEFNRETSESNVVFFNPLSTGILYSAVDEFIYYWDPIKESLFSYTDGKSEIVDLRLIHEQETVPSREFTVQNIWQAEANTDIVMLQINESFHYIDFSTGYTEQFEDIAEVYAISEDGKSVLCKDGEGNLRTITFRETIRTRDAIANNYSVTTLGTNMFKTTQNSHLLVAFEENVISFVDSTGFNRYDLEITEIETIENTIVTEELLVIVFGTAIDGESEIRIVDLSL